MTTQTQPRALYLLNFISMWECFSYYGMRVLLVLFMVHELNYSDSQAFCVYALYTTLVEFGGILGGVAADRWLGFKRAIALGGITIALGHICMTYPNSESMLFLGLAFIIVGTSLFRSNVLAFLGQFYEDNDPRKDSGYTLYYTGINLGGFLAATFCGVIAEVYGYHAGFGLAALGMMLGNISLYLGRRLLIPSSQKVVERKKRTTLIGAAAILAAAPLVAITLFFSEGSSRLFPFAAAGVIFYLFRQIKQMSRSEVQGFKQLGIYVVFLIIFYACEEQLGSTLVLFSERHVDRVTSLGTFPAASLVTFNPLTILLIGPFVSRLLQRVSLEPLTKIGMSFGFLSAAFYTLYTGALFASQQEEISLAIAIGSICLISLGEILIGPTLYATASDLAPKALQGLVMGIVTLGFSMANLFSGLLSHMMVVTEENQSLEIYTSGFGTIGFAASVVAALIFLYGMRRRVLA